MAQAKQTKPPTILRQGNGDENNKLKKLREYCVAHKDNVMILIKLR